MRVDTMAGKFRDNPHYLQMVDLLQEIHVLMCQGRGDTEEAERLREEMEVPWQDLTDEERSRIEGLSADLYTLESDSPIVHPQEPGIYAEELADEVQKAREAGDYDRVLALLRARPGEISADRAAALRAFSYECLGERHVALQFLEHAVRASSSPGSYVALLLLHLLQYGEHERALRWAREVQRIVKEPSAQLLSITAQVFFDASQRNGRSVQRDFLDEAIRACTAALDKLRHLDLDPRQRPLAVICHLEIAVCHYLLDNPQAALAEIDASLRLDPNDEVARTMRGLLNRGSNWQAAIQDFRRAIQSQASSVWPYFYVAYESLSTGDYQGCLEACSAALPLSPDASVAASLNEWTAICLAELGAPSELVESYFQTALDFRPHHRRVVANLERFRASHRIGPSAPSSWMVCQDVEPTTAADRYVRTWPKRMPAPVAVG